MLSHPARTNSSSEPITCELINSMTIRIIKIALKITLQILPVTTHRKKFFHYQLLKEADQIHRLKEAS